MPRGRQFSDVLDDLRSEIGHSLNTSHGVNTKQIYKNVLARVQRTLHKKHEWPFLMENTTLAISDGSYLYNYPSGYAYEGITEIWAEYSGNWYELEYGITPRHYADYNSPAGDKASPATRWQHKASTNQIEIWPCPDAAGTLYLTAKVDLGTFVADSDTCTLDSDLIVLYAAAEILAKQKSPDAPLKLRLAQELERILLSEQGTRKRQMFVSGGGADPKQGRQKLRPGIDYIP